MTLHTVESRNHKAACILSILLVLLGNAVSPIYSAAVRRVPSSPLINWNWAPNQYQLDRLQPKESIIAPQSTTRSIPADMQRQINQSGVLPDDQAFNIDFFGGAPVKFLASVATYTLVKLASAFIISHPALFPSPVIGLASNNIVSGFISFLAIVFIYFLRDNGPFEFLRSYEKRLDIKNGTLYRVLAITSSVVISGILSPSMLDGDLATATVFSLAVVIAIYWRYLPLFKEYYPGIIFSLIRTTALTLWFISFIKGTLSSAEVDLNPLSKFILSTKGIPVPETALTLEGQFSVLRLGLISGAIILAVVVRQFMGASTIPQGGFGGPDDENRRIIRFTNLKSAIKSYRPVTSLFVAEKPFVAIAKYDIAARSAPGELTVIDKLESSIIATSARFTIMLSVIWNTLYKTVDVQTWPDVNNIRALFQSVLTPLIENPLGSSLIYLVTIGVGYSILSTVSTESSKFRKTALQPLINSLWAASLVWSFAICTVFKLHSLSYLIGLVSSVLVLPLSWSSTYAYYLLLRYYTLPTLLFTPEYVPAIHPEFGYERSFQSLVYFCPTLIGENIKTVNSSILALNTDLDKLITQVENAMQEAANKK